MEKKLTTCIIKATVGCLLAGPLVVNTLQQFANGNPEAGFISAFATVGASSLAYSNFQNIFNANNESDTTRKNDLS